MPRLRKLTTASITNSDIRALRDVAEHVGFDKPGMAELIVTCDIALSTGEHPYRTIAAARKACVNIINARNAALAKGAR